MSLTLFQSDDFGMIRATTEDGKPLFVAKDIATALGYADSVNAIKAHCKGVVKRHLPHPQSETATIEVSMIPESDVYRLIMRSKLPSAERFQDWVVEEVLPKIRETGQYGVAIPTTLPDALRLAADLAEKNQALVIENAELKPKAEFHDAVTASDDVIQLAVVCQVLNLPFGRNTLFQRLRNAGVLISAGERHNLPKQEYVSRGLFTVKESQYLDSDKQVRVAFTTYATQKGLAWIKREFCKAA